MKKIGRYFLYIAFAAAVGLFLVTCAGSAQKSDDFSSVLKDVKLGPIAPAYMEQQPFNDKTAAEFVAGIKVGWNLGNTLDVTDISYLEITTPLFRLETAWGNPVTTKEHINAIKNAGFDTIRIPVSWAKASDSSYNIREDWMIRVTEVVNWAVENDMYVIINTHHDESIFKFTNSGVERSLVAFRKIWMQIAAQFKNYNEKLIFEPLNEPRTKGSDKEWQGGTSEEHKNLNKYYDAFIDVV